jgi:hypothetical protein
VKGVPCCWLAVDCDDFVVDCDDVVVDCHILFLSLAIFVTECAGHGLAAFIWWQHHPRQQIQAPQLIFSPLHMTVIH